MRNILSINKDWRFLKNTAVAPAQYSCNGEHVDLPHTWNAKDGQDGGNDYFRGTCCYLKNLKKSDLPKNDCYYLEINGANSSADVYLNGKHICHHDGGYSAFRVNITPSLKEENLICVLVDNSPNDTVYPQTADFTFYGGLYRDVNIIGVSITHFALEPFGTNGIFITPEIEDGTARVNIRTEAVNLKAGDKFRFEITDADGKAVCLHEQDKSTAELSISNVHTWHGTKDPYLYKARVDIFRDGTILDTVESKFGCRSYQIDPEKGFILNGQEYPLHGVSRHQDRKNIGNALLPEHHREDMELIHEMGANTIRLAHYQHDKYFYELCDEYGMAVWAEIPYISRHMQSANDNTVSQMAELITQCYNHPSIVVWGLSNEITMNGSDDRDLINQHKKLNALAHSMDKTRKTAIACLSVCGIDEQYVHIPDVVSYNHYFGWYGGEHTEYGAWFDKFHEKYPNTPIGVSEYGCEALNWHNSNPESGDYSEEYQAIYHESLIKQLFSRKYLWATHVWNMFDFGADARVEGGENGQNHKGLITIDRKYKKDAFFAYKAWLSDEPFVHICGKRYVDRTEDITRITVYSSLPCVELFANGKSLAKKATKDHFFYFEVPNIGETRLKAVAGKYQDESKIRKVEKPNESYILREQGAVLNWFDITQKDDAYSLNDKIGDIIKTDNGRLWLADFFNMLKSKQQSTDTHGFEMTEQTVNMLNSLSVLRLTGMLSMTGIAFTKEELLTINEKLNNIKKFCP